MSDEVSQFLEQVEQLRGKQIEDDQLRAREREEFMAAKRERQARREGESLSSSRPDPEGSNVACTLLVGLCKKTKKSIQQRKSHEEIKSYSRPAASDGSPGWQLAENAVPSPGTTVIKQSTSTAHPAATTTRILKVH